ncbi:MAG: PQQ-like beta-propeller repeat protein [Thermoguttaceae bacterium]|jgi:outer membrane protein assembly factor BamB|nr:PQQ-like beta-propeller repeat protein [Thermoguttaceae bacterium]
MNFLSRACFTCLLLTAPAAADDARRECSWPQFHGPRRDNLSPDTGLLRRWPDEGPQLLWRAEGLGHGFATVSIADGRIVTAGDVGDMTVITALDLDGRVLWQADNGPAWTGPQPGARGTPTIDGERIYHLSAVGDLVCLEAESGRRVWGLNILEKFESQNIQWALAEAVLVDGDHVICSPGGPRTAMVAIHKEDGRTAWESQSAGDLAGYASPSMGVFQGVRMIFTLTSQAVIGVNADSGELLWRFEHITPWRENILKPIYHDGHVLASSQKTGSVLLRLTVDGRRVSVEPVWRNADLDSHHGGIVLVDGHLYGCGRFNRDQWACLEWSTGRTRYLDAGVGKGSLTYADGLLITRSERGPVGLVEATPNGHHIISRFEPPKEAEGPAWAHPVVCGGRLYLRHGEFLYCYRVR